jgi:flagellar protein FliS
MATTNPYEEYIKTQFTTATPGKLLLMAYDGAIRFVKVAAEKMKEGKLDEQSINIRKAQNIIAELMASLNPQANKELADSLSALYSYIFDRLTHANIKDDLRALNEVISILTELRAAWAQAEEAIRTNATSKARAA